MNKDTIYTNINIDERARPLIARVNRQAKRLILKVDAVRGEVHVTAPSRRSLPEALEFARSRTQWLAGQFDESLEEKAFAAGGDVLFRGERLEIVRSGSLRGPVRIDIEAGEMVVGGDPDHTNRRVVDFLKREARRELIRAVDHYCAKIDRKRGKLSVRDTKTRWGSCSSDGDLSFSWRLIMAPPAILDYVAAHECAHLIHMNHSPAFWRLVREMGVDARSSERWFAANGAGLFGFGARPS